jgi:pyrroline-5-carboxylate reductase
VILSIAAGTTIAAIEEELGRGHAIIRSMPNTPALIGEGISGVVAGDHCQDKHRRLAERVLGAGGEVIWIPDESLMDAVTAVSGSGPAYFFLLTEALAEAGTRLGLSGEVSRRLAEQTCSGAGAMLKQSELGAAELRKRVTSPGGTTQAALNAFEEGGFSELVFAAAEAARQRGEELAQQDG